MKMCTRLALFLVGLTLAAAVRPALADDDATREYQIKAALIFKFAQYTEWPAKAFANDSDPIIVATVGPDPFGGSLEAVIAGKSIGNHPVVVQHFPDADHLGRCHVLFVARSELDQMPAILQHLSQSPVLTAADSNGFCESGGILQFFLEDQKIHFEINTDALDRSGIKISSRLLKLAKVYKQS